MSQPEIRRLVVVSTAHLTETTAKYLDRTPASEWPCVGGPYAGYGWFVHASEENLGEGFSAIPDDLFSVMTWARRQGCGYVLFDCDGYQVEGLPVHDW